MKDDFNKPPREYAFFKAEGASMDAISRVERARMGVDEVEDRISERYGANMVFFGWNKPEAWLYFHKDKPPVFDGWVETKKTSDPNISRYAPPEGSTDEKTLLALAGVVFEHYKQYTLEKVFGVKPHERDFPAGSYHDAFVIPGLLASPNMNACVPPSGNVGYIKPVYGRGIYASGSPCHGTDMMVYTKMLDDWYIRVPCDKSGKPFFDPPDAVPVDYRDMLAIDRAHSRIQQAIRLGISDDNDGPDYSG